MRFVNIALALAAAIVISFAVWNYGKQSALGGGLQGDFEPQVAYGPVDLTEDNAHRRSDSLPLEEVNASGPSLSILDATTGKKITNPEVKQRLGDESSTLLQSNKDGTFALGGEPPFLVEVACDGYVGRSTQFQNDAKELTISLEPSGVIEGRLIDNLGNTAPEGVSILAYRVSTGPMPFDRFVRGDRFIAGNEVITARTDSNGHFRIDRIKKGTDYFVRAVGRGILSEVSRSTASTGEYLELVGAVLVGGWLKFRTESGDSPRLCEGYEDSYSLSYSFPDPDRIGVAWLADKYASIFSADPDIFDLQGLEKHGLIFGWAPFRGSPENSIPFRWEALGYETIEGQLSLAPVHEGIHVEHVLVRELGFNWSTLKVKFHSPPGIEWAASKRNDPNKFRLYLERLDTDSDEPEGLSILYLHPGEGTQTFENFPAGQYRVRLFSGIGPTWRLLETIPDSVVTLLPNSTSEIEVDLTQTGAVEFVLSDSRLRPYQGRMVVRMTRVVGDRKMHSETQFTGPPYRLAGLPEGEYQLFFDAPDIYPTPKGEILESPGFLVEVGKLTTVDYQVDDSLVGTYD